MKTTLEIPDALFRQAKTSAAERGLPLRELISQAIEEHLRNPEKQDRPWLKEFGKLRSLHEETHRISQAIRQEFDQLEP